MSETIIIEVVTPERAVLTGTCAEVVLPGTEGQMGILPGHLPVLSGLAIGEMTIKDFVSDAKGSPGTRRFFVDGGFVEVLPDKVSVMTEACEGVDDIDVAAAKVSIADAEKSLQDAKGEDVEQEVLKRHQDAIKRARMRVMTAESGE